MRNAKSLTLAAAGILAILATSWPAYAQDITTGRITGRVADDSGQPLPGVSVEAKNSGTGLVAVQVSDAKGLYRIVNLPVGTYDVSAALSGFQGQSKKGVQVTVGSSLTADFTLKLASVSSEIVVTSEVPVVETSQTTTQTTVESAAITSLPIQGRNFTDFVLLTPNAQRETQRGNLALDGQRGINTEVTLDGVDFTNAFFGGVAGSAEGRAPISISQESIREFQVVQAGASAEFGRSGGGFINVVTKSGTNEFHGSAFYYNRPNSMVAKLADGTEPKESKKRNLGASLGGPVVKDRFFFFASYEQQRQTTTIPVNQTVRDAEAILVAKYPSYPVTGTQFTQGQDGDVYFGKLDFQLNDRNRINARVNHTKYDGLNGTNGSSTGSEAHNGIEGLTATSAVANWNGSFGKNGSLINDLNLQYSKEDIPRQNNSLGDSLPEIQISGGPILGGVSFLPITAKQDRYTLYESLTFLTGQHVAKGGIEYNDTGMDQVFKGNWRGVYIFNAAGGRTAQQNFEQGKWDQYREFIGLNGLTADQAGQYNKRQKELGFFLQDQWFASSNLTLTLGLRYERQNNPDDPVLDRNILVAQTVKDSQAAQKALVGSIPDANNQWSPRLSVAWSPGTDGKTVVRFSAGRYWSRFPAILTSQLYTSNGVVGNQYTVTGAGSTGPAAGVQAPGWGPAFNATQRQAIGTLTGTGSVPGVFSIDPNFKNAHTDQATLGGEREILGISFGLEGTYARAENLQRITDDNLQATDPANCVANNPRFDPTAGVSCYAIKSGTRYVPNRPNPNFSTITTYTSDARSRFWSVTAKFRKNFRGGLRFFGSVTRGEDKDSDSNERNFSGFFLEDVNNPELNYSFSDRDIKWRFLANGSYDFKIASFMDGVVGILFNYQTGRPFTPRAGSDLNLDGQSGTDRPTVDGVHFERNSYRFPDFYTVDARFGLAFGLGPGRLSLIGEIYNLTNTGNRGTSNTTYGVGPAPSATFGVLNQVTTTPRTVQLAARYDF